MANADTHADMVRIVDNKIAELFKNYSNQFEKTESAEEELIIKELNNINEKLNLILNSISSLNISNLNNIDTPTKQSTRTKQAKKEEVYIPVIEKTESIVNKKEDKSKKIESSGIMNTLSILNNLKK